MPFFHSPFFALARAQSYGPSFPSPPSLFNADLAGELVDPSESPWNFIPQLARGAKRAIYESSGVSLDLRPGARHPIRGPAPPLRRSLTGLNRKIIDRQGARECVRVCGARMGVCYPRGGSVGLFELRAAQGKSFFAQFA